ncbi:MAG: hypothetical protein MHM6MM_001314 [Cercozoa sp. M6MM]
MFSKKYNRAPRFNYFLRALSGEFDMKNEGPLKLLRKGVEECGEIFHMKVAHKNLTVLMGPEATKVMFESKDHEIGQKEVYDFTIPVFGKNVVYDSPVEVMAQQLKFVSTALKKRNALRNAVPKAAGEAFKHVAAMYKEEGEINIHEMCSVLTLNSAARVLLGDTCRESLRHEFGSLYQDLSDGMSHLSYFLPYLPTKAHRQRDAARKRIGEVFKNVIKMRKASGVSEDGFLDVLLDARYRDGRKLNDDEICGLTVAALFGGQHTSAITTTWLAMLTSMPQYRYVADKIREEFEEALQKTDYVLNWETVELMPFAHACVKETLRMFPPLISLLRYARADLKCGKYDIPKGDIVVTSPSVLHHLPQYYEDPEVFKPERFLHEDVSVENQHGSSFNDTKHLYIPFGSGRHSCMGERYGILQIKIVFAIMLRELDFELVNPDFDPKVDYSAIVAGPPHEDCMLRYKRRHPSPEISIEI